MKKCWLMFGMLFFASLVHAQTPVSKSFFTGVAIGGQDTVAYHQTITGASIAGEKQFSVEWQGATWRFASQAALDKFSANPSQWVPEFNGHCANALSLGEGLVKTDGTVWQFFDDKLYLFYAEQGLKRWQDGDDEQYRHDAEQAWSNIVNK